MVPLPLRGEGDRFLCDFEGFTRSVVFPFDFSIFTLLLDDCNKAGFVPLFVGGDGDLAHTLLLTTKSRLILSNWEFLRGLGDKF